MCPHQSNPEDLTYCIYTYVTTSSDSWDRDEGKGNAWWEKDSIFTGTSLPDLDSSNRCQSLQPASHSLGCTWLWNAEASFQLHNTQSGSWLRKHREKLIQLKTQLLIRFWRQHLRQSEFLMCSYLEGKISWGKTEISCTGNSRLQATGKCCVQCWEVRTGNWF